MKTLELSPLAEPRSGPMLVDEGPIDLNAQTRQIVQMHHAVMHFWTRGIHAVLDRMALGIAMRLHTKTAGAEGGDDMPMDMRGGVRRD